MPLFLSHSPLTSSESLPDGSWPELISSAICTHGCPLFFILAAPGDTRFHWLLVFQKDISILFPAITKVLLLVVASLPEFLNFQAGSVLTALYWASLGTGGAAALFHRCGTLLPIRMKGALMHLEACNGPHSVLWSGPVEDGCMYLVFFPFSSLLRLQVTQYLVYTKLCEDCIKMETNSEQQFLCWFSSSLQTGPLKSS